MRIAYVAYHLEKVYVKGGVGRKFIDQMRTWQKAGHEVRMFLHTPDVDEFFNADIFPYNARTNLPQRELNRSRALAGLIEAVRAYRPDIIYLRYGLFCLPLQSIFTIAPVVVEINTKDAHEYFLRGKFYGNLNRLTRGLILRPAAGLIPNSPEIANQPENLALHRPTRVVANGIDFSSIEPLPAPNNPTPVLGFVGSPGRSWHGVDKLFALAERCPELRLEIIGYDQKDFDIPPLPNMAFRGFLPLPQVREILAGCDAAFGLLALHRKNMEEDSPLKVRDALAYGLPMIFGYRDVDLSAANFDFILQIPNTPDNVAESAQQIRDFAYRMRGRRAPRELVQPLLDQTIKEQQRLDFFASFLQPKK